MITLVMAAPAAMLQALGRFLVETHKHPRQPDPERTWLRRAVSCPACDELRAALGLAPDRAS